jgi:hypothetical protein
MAAADAFNPLRVVVLSELTAREKDRFYQILVEQDAKFHLDSNSRIVSNVRLLGPNAPRLIEEGRQHKVKEQIGFSQRLARLDNAPVEGVQVAIQGVPDIDYSSYRTFVALASEDGEIVKPKKHVLTWVMRLVEDFYDARFTAEKINVERDPNQVSSAPMDSFPIFVVKQLCTLVGLKPIVDQFCWDLLYNAHIYRRDFLEMEIFMRFVQEFYDNDDLLFFLYARSVVAKTLRLNYKRRWCTTDGPGRGPKALWMSFKEAVAVSKVIFGVNEDNRALLTDFMSLVMPNLVGQKTEKVDSRRIDITQFLHLAVVGYHQFQAEESMGGPPPQRHAGGGTVERAAASSEAGAGGDQWTSGGPQSLAQAMGMVQEQEQEGVEVDQEQYDGDYNATLDQLARAQQETAHESEEPPLFTDYYEGDMGGGEGMAEGSRLAQFLSEQEQGGVDMGDNVGTGDGSGGDGSEGGERQSVDTGLLSASAAQFSDAAVADMTDFPGHDGDGLQVDEEQVEQHQEEGEEGEEEVLEAWEEGAMSMHADEALQEALQMVQLDHESEFLDMLMAAVADALNEEHIDEVLEYLTDTLHMHVNEVYGANFRGAELHGVEDFQDCLEQIINNEGFIDAICLKRDQFCAQYTA